MRFLHKERVGDLQDFAPILPEFKVDKGLEVSEICELSKEVSFNVVFFEMTDDEMNDLRSFLLASDDLRVKADDLDELGPYVDNILGITSNCSVAAEVIGNFAERNSVQWIERSYENKLFTRFANGVVQSGDPDKLPLFAANLTGLDQVIGIADTGLDVQSCFFYDENVDTPFNVQEDTHRKVIYYKTQSDGVDFSGHGTLVSSAAAGRCSNDNSEFARYNGAAPDAKIAFIDIGSGVLSEDGVEYINAGSNHYRTIYEVLYNKGSRVMTMSWGSSSNAYTAQAR